MSSHYVAICLAHDPAWLAGAGLVQHDNVRDAFATGQREHPRCPLLVGRWSGALVQVCCPGQVPSTLMPPGHVGFHRVDMWAEAGWLRLLALADPAQVKRARTPGCWSPATIALLRDLLDLGDVS